MFITAVFVLFLIKLSQVIDPLVLLFAVITQVAQARNMSIGEHRLVA